MALHTKQQSLTGNNHFSQVIIILYNIRLKVWGQGEIT